MIFWVSLFVITVTMDWLIVNASTEEEELVAAVLGIIAMIMILPLILGINGIWMAVIAAELLALFVSLIFIIINRKKYGYV